MIITLEMLQAKGACDKGISAFKELYGEGGEITLERCQSMVAVNVSFLDWAACNFLGSAEAYAVYDRPCDQAWAAYKAAVAEAFYQASQAQNGRTPCATSAQYP